jgi:hypothetical protein
LRETNSSLSNDASPPIFCCDAMRTWRRRGLPPPLVERRDKFHCQHETKRPAGVAHGRLSGLGLSPHPGVVLVIEGETEEVLFPLVRDHLQMPRQFEVVQSLVLRGVGKDLTKLAAFASAPLIERKERDGWLLVTRGRTQGGLLLGPGSVEGRGLTGGDGASGSLASD